MTSRLTWHAAKSKSGENKSVTGRPIKKNSLDVFLAKLFYVFSKTHEKECIYQTNDCISTHKGK